MIPIKCTLSNFFAARGSYENKRCQTATIAHEEASRVRETETRPVAYDTALTVTKTWMIGHHCQW